MLFKRYKSTEVDSRTWLHVPSGTPWSTSSDTHQVVVGYDLIASAKFCKRLYLLSRDGFIHLYHIIL